VGAPISIAPTERPRACTGTGRRKAGKAATDPKRFAPLTGPRTALRRDGAGVIGQT